MFERLFEYKPPYAWGGGLTEKTNHNQVQHLY